VAIATLIVFRVSMHALVDAVDARVHQTCRRREMVSQRSGRFSRLADCGMSGCAHSMLT
jgi:hypothetical protein